MNNLTNLVETIFNVVEKQKTIEDVQDALKYMYICLNTEIKPFLYAFMEDAQIYRQQRDDNNVKLFKMLYKTEKILKSAFENNKLVTVLPMSSICARMNLITESDIDFGILIHELNLPCDNVDCIKYEAVETILEEYGFRYSHVFNQSNSANRYFSFCKHVNVSEDVYEDVGKNADKNTIEIEVKIRDFDTSLPIVELHNWLNTQLSEDDITLYTFTKFLLKQYDNENKTDIYSKFKKIIYESAFSCIGGKFLL